MKLFKTDSGQLRNIWWVAIFFLVLAAITFPAILIARQYKQEISIAQQAVIVLAATWICQLLRRKSFFEVAGRPDATWLKQWLHGMIAGAGLMLVPAAVLYAGGWVHWESQPAGLWSLWSAAGTFLCVAVAEEFLFHGFMFQRLIGSTGVWVAQLVMAGYFLLIHTDNPGMDGTVRMLASVNIFIASLLFGLAYIKTKSLAMPIGIHLMANWVQGTLLGFGVSGNEEAGLFKPVFSPAPLWLTGGTFGLEASLFGLVVLMATIVSVYFWYPSENGTTFIHTNKILES